MSSDQEIFNFATIGEVFDDGVSLIFDGQEEATEKHYKVNTSIVFNAGDRVKILADSGTYVVEYVVGPPMQPEEAVVGIPAGGSAGQVLAKSSTEDYSVKWSDIDTDVEGTLPTGGTAGQVLMKSTGTNYDVKWGTLSVDGALPTGGTAGQVLKKSSSTNYAATWGSVDGILPTGGSSGQVLKKSSSTNYAATWGSVDGTMPTGGTSGQCLVKNSGSNYDVKWGSPSSPAAVNAMINQNYSSNSNYYIYFRTDSSGNFYIRLGTNGTWKKITVG